MNTDIIRQAPERVVILVDVQNVYYTTRQAYKRNFNYNAFWRRATQGKTVVKANAYAINKGDIKQQEFQNILRAIGFEVKLKPFIQRADGSAKGDWDVGITVDAMQLSSQADKIILLSGDGDFDILGQTLRTDYGKKFEVYGVPHLTAMSLVNAADNFIPIEGDLLL